jgi:hypothetical protein
MDVIRSMVDVAKFITFIFHTTEFFYVFNIESDAFNQKNFDRTRWINFLDNVKMNIPDIITHSDEHKYSVRYNDYKIFFSIVTDFSLTYGAQSSLVVNSENCISGIEKLIAMI